MRPHLRLLMRSAALTASVLPFLPFTEWPTAMACVIAVSPFVSLSAALGGRHLALVTMACLPLIILAFSKHRWFCWNLCPTGFILELTSFRQRPKEIHFPRSGCKIPEKDGHDKTWPATVQSNELFSTLEGCAPSRPQNSFPNLGKWLLVLGIGMAAAGYPLLMIFDPLIILSGFLSTWQGRNVGWKVFAPAFPLLGLIALNIIRPNLWCHRLCPLGAAQHFLGMTGRRFHHRQAPPQEGHTCDNYTHVGGALARDNHPRADFLHQSEINESVPATGVKRRFFLLALLGGIAGWALITKKSGAAVIRPPGAVNENIFTGLCSRCGNCINVCPESIIIPDLGASGLRGLLTPILKYNRGYCNEWCLKCLLACPTSAIRRLSLEQKRITAIGTAQIDKLLCLAWTDRQECMVCQEFCPYQAIAIVENDGVNCPEVKEEVCRGCGACENHCPAIPKQAIVVRGIPSQRTVEPMVQLE